MDLTATILRTQTDNNNNNKIKNSNNKIRNNNKTQKQKEFRWIPYWRRLHNSHEMENLWQLTVFAGKSNTRHRKNQSIWKLQVHNNDRYLLKKWRKIKRPTHARRLAVFDCRELPFTTHTHIVKNRKQYCVYYI